MSSRKKKLTHTQKWKKLAAIPGFRGSVSGLYHKSHSNVGKINALYKRLEYQTRYPEKFAVVRPRSKTTARNLRYSGVKGRGSEIVVPRLGFESVRIQHGSVVRTLHKPAGRETLTVRAREIIAPGSKIAQRTRALDPRRYSRGRGRLMVQIGDRAPFWLGQNVEAPQPIALADALERYKWRDARGLNHLQHYMHIVFYERRSPMEIIEKDNPFDVDGDEEFEE